MTKHGVVAKMLNCDVNKWLEMKKWENPDYIYLDLV